AGGKIAVDSSGRIYLVSGTIHRYDDMTGAGHVSLSVTNTPVFTGFTPWALTVDSSGKIYVTGGVGIDMAVLGTDGMAGTNGAGFKPGGTSSSYMPIDVLGNGQLYFASCPSLPGTLYRTDGISGANQRQSTSYGGGPLSLSRPEGVAYDPITVY